MIWTYFQTIISINRFIKKGDNLNALNLLKSYSPLLMNLPPDKAYETLSKCQEILDGLQKMDLGRVTIKEFLKRL